MVHREMVMPPEGIKVIVAGNTMKLVPPEGKQTTEFSFALDPTTKRKAFDRTDPDGEFKGQVYPGIYKFDGDTLKLCIPNKPSKARPTDFHLLTPRIGPGGDDADPANEVARIGASNSKPVFVKTS